MLFSLGAPELLILLLVVVYPAVCIGKIASKLGKSGVTYGILAAIPLGKPGSVWGY